MENANNLNLQKLFTDNLQQMLDVSVSAMKPIVDGLAGNLSTIGSSVLDPKTGTFKLPQFTLQNTDCCAPKNECPPHCISSITRQALPGERIIVPFTIKNACNVAKTWRVGVRELKDEDGSMAPSQPQLNKQKVTLDPGRTERVLMAVDLGKFQPGTYYTEIVLREKEFNQNICFTLTVSDEGGIVVSPQDEQKYRLKWQSWQSHYYCERPRVKAGQISNEPIKH